MEVRLNIGIVGFVVFFIRVENLGEGFDLWMRVVLWVRMCYV